VANIKTRLRQEKVARLSALGLPDSEIAIHIGLTPAGVATLKQSPEYKALALQIATGVISDYDETLSEDLENVKQRIQSMVPDALQAFADAVTQKADPKLRMAAAETILDRHGVFTKAARTQTVEEQKAASFITSKDDAVAQSLAGAIAPTTP